MVGAFAFCKEGTKLYVGISPVIPGAHTQGASLDEMQKDLKQVVELCLEEFKGTIEDLT